MRITAVIFSCMAAKFFDRRNFYHETFIGIVGSICARYGFCGVRGSAGFREVHG